MNTKTLAWMVLYSPLVVGCVGELPTLPPGTDLSPMPEESARKIVVISSVSEFVPPPLARELEACKTSLAQVTRDRDLAISRGVELENRVSALESQAARAALLDKQLADEVQAGREFQQRLSRLEQEATQSRATEQRLMQELQAAQKKASETQVSTQQQIELAEQEISRRKAALAETTKHLATLDQDKQKIAAALTDSQRRLEELSVTLSAEQARAASLSQENQRLGQSYDSLSQENQRLGQSYDSLKKSLEAELADRDLKLRQAQSRVVVTILDHVLFDSGQAVLKPSGMKVLDQVSTALKKISDKEIHVEGHTDNRPIRGPLAKHYPTNWELSTARATTVVRYFIEQTGLPAASLSAVGYADTRPVAVNDTDTSRAENRRIEILLYPKGLPRTSQPPKP